MDFEAQCEECEHEVTNTRPSTRPVLGEMAQLDQRARALLLRADELQEEGAALHVRSPSTPPRQATCNT